MSAPTVETRRGVQIVRVGLPGFGRERLAGRSADYLIFHLKAGVRVAFGSRPDFVVALTTPSLLPATVRVICDARRVPYGVWAMDLHPEVEERLGLLPGPLAREALRAMGAYGYKGADFVVGLGPCMAGKIRAKGVPRERIHEIPVWSRGQILRPVDPVQNSLRRRLGYSMSDFVVLYSGNAGLAHEFGPIVEAMGELRDDEDVHFLFVGDGPRRCEIEHAVSRLRIDRFRYLEYFKRDELSALLGVGDLHLLSLRQDMAGLLAPSKLFGSMAAGRPVLMLGPNDSDPAIVIDREGIGVVVDLRELDGGIALAGRRLASEIRELRDDVDRRRALGLRARRAFELGYDRAVGCAAWRRLLLKRLRAPNDGSRI